MTNNVYVIYNNLSRRYGDVMAYPSDAYASQRMAEIIQRGAMPYKETELCRVGTVDVDSGVITPCDPIRVAIPELSDPQARPVAPMEAK